jgi:hypothetical protein
MTTAHRVTRTRHYVEQSLLFEETHNWTLRFVCRSAVHTRQRRSSKFITPVTAATHPALCTPRPLLQHTLLAAFTGPPCLGVLTGATANKKEDRDSTLTMRSLFTLLALALALATLASASNCGPLPWLPNTQGATAAVNCGWCGVSSQVTKYDTMSPHVGVSEPLGERAAC